MKRHFGKWLTAAALAVGCTVMTANAFADILIRLLFSSVFQELSPLWGQFFLFLTHFNRLHQKKQFFFGFGKKMHGKGIFVTLLLRILC